MYASEFVCKSVRESRTSHYGIDGLKESWQHHWRCQRQQCIIWIVDSTIRVHSNSLKPVLMEENKVAWLIMALDSCDPQDPMKFLDMMDHIHITEICPSRRVGHFKVPC